MAEPWNGIPPTPDIWHLLRRKTDDVECVWQWSDPYWALPETQEWVMTSPRDVAHWWDYICPMVRAD